MKRIVRLCFDILFAISLALLGKFDTNDFELSQYQIIITVFWVTGILKFMNTENSIKESVLDSIKDLVISITIIPLWYWVSGSMDNDLYEPLFVILHYVILMIILKCAQKRVALSGSVVYYTYAAIPIICIILIRLNVPVNVSVIIAVLLVELVNFFYFKKRISKNS